MSKKKVKPGKLARQKKRDPIKKKLKGLNKSTIGQAPNV